MNLSADLIRKIDLAFERYKKGDLPGDIIFTAEETEELRRNFSNLCSSSTSWNIQQQKEAAIYIIQFCKQFDGDWGNKFWQLIKTKTNKEVSNERRRTLGYLPKLYNGVVFASESKRNYASVFQFLSYAPKTSIEAFIELAWHLYCDANTFGFLFAGTEGDKKLCESIIDSLSSVLSGDLDDDLSPYEFDSTKYAIRSGLRHAFKEDKRRAANLLFRILGNIDRIYYNKVDDGSESYLKELCNATIKKLVIRSQTNAYCIERPKETVDSIQNIRPKYVLDSNGALCIYIPRIRLYASDYQAYQKAKVRLWVDDRNGFEPIKISYKEFDCVNEGFRHALKEIYIPIESYLRHCNHRIGFQLTLSFDDRPPFLDTKERLYRDYLIFRNDTEILDSFIRPGHVRIYCPANFNPETNYHQIGQQHISRREETFFETVFQNGERISYNGHHVIAGEMPSEIHFRYIDEGQEDLAALEYIGNDGNTYPVKRHLGDLIIRTDELISQQACALNISSDQGDLLHRPLTRFPVTGSTIFVKLSELISEIPNVDKEFMALTISIFDYQNNKTRFVQRFACCDDAEIIENPRTYLINGLARFEVRINHAIYSDKISTNQIEEAFDIWGRHFRLRLNYFRWGINERERKCQPENDPIFDEKFQSNDVLHIDTPLSIKCVKVGDVEVEKSNRNDNDYLIGKYVLSKQTKGALLKNDRLPVVAFENDGTQYRLFDLTDKPYLRSADPETLYDYNEQEDLLSVNLIGNYQGPNYSDFWLEVEEILGRNEITDAKRYDIKPENAAIHLTIGIYNLKLVCKKPDGQQTVLAESENLKFGNPDRKAVENYGGRIELEKICKKKVKGQVLTDIKFDSESDEILYFSCKIHANPGIKKAIDGFFAFYDNKIRAIYNDQFDPLSFDSKNLTLIANSNGDELKSIYMKR